MITGTVYLCEICGCMYCEKEKALACEQRHKTEHRITEWKAFDYARDSIDSEVYPKFMKVTFDNGRTMLYESKYFQGDGND